MRKILILSLLFICAGCGVPRQAKDVVRNKHAQAYILANRINDDDPSNDPTYEQLKTMATSTAKDWESMDRLLNNWKPEEIKSVDIDGKIKDDE
jgi:hypothetical protein